MKSALFAALFLLLALPASAQTRGAGAAPSAPIMSGGGGSAGFGGSSFGAIGFLSQSSSSDVHYQYIYAQGSDATFVPTRFVSYAEGLKLGRAALAYRPKTIAEIAAEYRASKAKLAAQPK